MSDIDKVIDYINEKGWHKGDLVGKDGSVCIIGAIQHCGHFNELADELDVLDERIQPAVEKLFPDRFKPGRLLHPVAKFNDHPDTTREDVMLVLKHAKGEG